LYREDPQHALIALKYDRPGIGDAAPQANVLARLVAGVHKLRVEPVWSGFKDLPPAGASMGANLCLRDILAWVLVASLDCLRKNAPVGPVAEEVALERALSVDPSSCRLDEAEGFLFSLQEEGMSLAVEERLHMLAKMDGITNHPIDKPFWAVRENEAIDELIPVNN
jgi:hypothetical protein